MVRGRRVRTLVAATKNDGCDSPKRKDQKLDFTGRIANTISPSALVKNQTITDYFQVVEVVEVVDPRTNELLDNDILIEETYLEQCNNNINNEVIEANIAEILMDQPERPSSTTPHRIVLPEQNSPTRGLSELHIAFPNNNNNNKRGPQPKAKRKLNVNQPSNQLLKCTTKDEIKTKTNNHTLTEYFPIRRSERKTKKTIIEEKRKTLEHCVRNDIEEGLEIKIFSDKGRGVVASQNFNKGDFVVEYKGELIDTAEARRRESIYALNENTGCYMYYFKHGESQYCIDATAETGYLGRLVNHSRNGNLSTKTVIVDGIPRLVLIAKDDINAGEELTYDYGDRSKESLMYHPWLAL